MENRRRHGGRRRILLFSLFLMSGLVALALSGSIASAAPPTLTIVSPANNSIVGNGSPVSVIFAVTDFNLTKPGTGGLPNPNVGHVNVFVDGVWTAEAHQLTILLDLASGVHGIRLQLVTNNGTALRPDVTSSIQVTTTQGPVNGQPTISITSPLPASVRGTDNAISFELRNFALVPPGGPSAPHEGHIHVYLDGVFYQELTSYEPPHFGLNDGSHTITLQLVDGAHRPLNPDVSASVTFTVNPGFGRAPDLSEPLAITDGLLGLAILGLLLFRGKLVKR